MRSGFFLALAAILLLSPATPSFAQTDSSEETESDALPVPPAPPPFDPNAEIFVVVGIAYNDLLNVRETPTAGGKMVGRLPNGSLLRNHGCRENNGATWCDIEALEDKTIRGWVAARYLLGSAVEGLPELPPADSAEPEIAALPGSGPSAEGGASAPGFDAVGDIPCARYYGQPMTHCSAAVNRRDDGEATVTVTWPDGGQRVILFTNGRADNSDSPDPLTYTREADLNLIRIGKSERFEIPDALPFGG